MTRNIAAEGNFELSWFKSSYSDSGEGDDCVEVAAAPATTHVRDSKSTDGPQLAFPSTAWLAFVTFAARS